MSMTLIATTTVGSGGASSIDFTSIPATYTDLMLVTSTRTAESVVANSQLLTVNGTTTGYSERRLQGNGTSASSTSISTTSFVQPDTNGSTSTASTFGSGQYYIPNYAGATNKSISADGVTENNSTTAFQQMSAQLWSNTAAITRLTLTMANGANFVQYSTASLYGIQKGSGGATVSP